MGQINAPWHMETRMVLRQLKGITLGGLVSLAIVWIVAPTWLIGTTLGLLAIALGTFLVLPLYMTIWRDVASAPMVHLGASAIKLVAIAIFAFVPYLLVERWIAVPPFALALGLTLGIVSAIVGVILTAVTDNHRQVSSQSVATLPGASQTISPPQTNHTHTTNTPMSGKAV